MKLILFRLYFKNYLQASTFVQDKKEYENWFNYRMIKINHLRRNEMGVWVELFLYCCKSLFYFSDFMI